MPGMHKEVQDSFDQVIPGAVAHADTFLGVIQQRCNGAGIGVSLTPMRTSRKDERIVMRGDIEFGNAWKGKRSYTVDVYAYPMGQALQVGWQLTSNEVSTNALGRSTSIGVIAHNTQARIHNDPNTQRQLSGTVQAFHQMVFLPTLQNLIDAVGAPRSSNGFLGA